MKRVLTLEWLDPLMPGGHWVPEMISIAGGVSGPIEPGQPSRKFAWEDLPAREADVIILMPCGFDPRRSAIEAAALWRLSGWPALPAVTSGEVYTTDGNAYFSRPGPRLVEGIEILARILHPDVSASCAAGIGPQADERRRSAAAVRGVRLTEPKPRKPPRVLIAALPERYALPARPTGSPVAARDAHRQTTFLLGAELAAFEAAMNVQLRIVAANSKAKGPPAAALFSLWSRTFGHLADACTLMASGSYASCPPLLRAALDCLAAQRSMVEDRFEQYGEWIASAVSQDREQNALAIDCGHFRAASVLIEDKELGALYRLFSDLTMPHVGATLFLVAPETSLQKAPVGFADSSFHLGWAELITGWLLRLASLQIEITATSGVFTLDKTLTMDAESVQREIRTALDNKRRCHVEVIDGRYFFRNFRRAPSGQPKRVILG